jgi:hypothetical protein
MSTSETKNGLSTFPIHELTELMLLYDQTVKLLVAQIQGKRQAVSHQASTSPAMLADTFGGEENKKIFAESIAAYAEQMVRKSIGMVPLKIVSDLVEVLVALIPSQSLPQEFRDRLSELVTENAGNMIENAVNAVTRAQDLKSLGDSLVGLATENRATEEAAREMGLKFSDERKKLVTAMVLQAELADALGQSVDALVKAKASKGPEKTPNVKQGEEEQ